jgi:hypothetical protein
VTEDQIRHCAPARYLCGLTESEWTPDANTNQDFEQQLGEDGMRRLNEYVVKWAVEEKLADPQLVVADTTAQEAAIPHPNEMGLMATFVTGGGGEQAGRRRVEGFLEKAGGLFVAANVSGSAGGSRDCGAVPASDAGEDQDRPSRLAVRGARGEGSRDAVRQAAEGVRLRPRRLITWKVSTKSASLAFARSVSRLIKVASLDARPGVAVPAGASARYLNP